jgi:hypothetical protein
MVEWWLSVREAMGSYRWTAQGRFLGLRLRMDMCLFGCYDSVYCGVPRR